MPEVASVQVSMIRLNVPEVRNTGGRDENQLHGGLSGMKTMEARLGIPGLKHILGLCPCFALPGDSLTRGEVFQAQLMIVGWGRVAWVNLPITSSFPSPPARLLPESGHVWVESWEVCLLQRAGQAAPPWHELF